MQYAIVVAAGRGTRFGAKKQYIGLAGEPMWVRSVEALFAGGARTVYLVVPSGDEELLKDEVSSREWSERCRVVAGRDTRFASVKAGFEQLKMDVEDDLTNIFVAIHDAARPFVKPTDVKAVFAAAKENRAALLGTWCPDTVKECAGSSVVRTIQRDNLFLAETPQVLRGDVMNLGYIVNPPLEAPTDDAAVAESLGVPVHCVASTGYNRKITTREDFLVAEYLAEKLWGGMNS